MKDKAQGPVHHVFEVGESIPALDVTPAPYDRAEQERDPRTGKVTISIRPRWWCRLLIRLFARLTLGKKRSAFLTRQRQRRGVKITVLPVDVP